MSSLLPTITQAREALGIFPSKFGKVLYPDLNDAPCTDRWELPVNWTLLTFMLIFLYPAGSLAWFGIVWRMMLYLGLKNAGRAELLTELPPLQPEEQADKIMEECKCKYWERWNCNMAAVVAQNYSEHSKVSVVSKTKTKDVQKIHAEKY